MAGILIGVLWGRSSGCPDGDGPSFPADTARTSSRARVCRAAGDLRAGRGGRSTGKTLQAGSHIRGTAVETLAGLHQAGADSIPAIRPAADPVQPRPMHARSLAGAAEEPIGEDLERGLTRGTLLLTLSDMRQALGPGAGIRPDPGKAEALEKARAV